MATCFMVDDLDECWVDGGEQRVGAMTWWSHDRKSYDTQPRPMPHLVVMTEAGLACVDCPATKEPHGYWTRTGEPPVVTVTPSLLINPDATTAPTWHGHLTEGVLIP